MAAIPDLVVLSFASNDPSPELLRLEVELGHLVRGVRGSVDGTGIGENEFEVFLVGPNGERLLGVVLDHLASLAVPSGSKAIIRSPGVGDRVTQTTVAIGSGAERTRSVEVLEKPGANHDVGDWFVLSEYPGFEPGFVVGRIIAKGDDDVCGVYFGPIRPSPPALADVAGLTIDQAWGVAVSSDEFLRDGGAQLLGGHSDFDPSAWPIPEFETVTRPFGEVVTIDRSFNQQRRPLPEAERGQRPKWRPGGGTPIIKIWRSYGSEMDRG